MFIEWIPDHWVPCFFSLPWHDVSKFPKLCTSLTLPSWWSYRICMCVCVCVCVCVCILWLSLVQLATLWTVAYQAPLSMAFSRQGYCSGLPFTTPGGLPDPGIEPRSPALAGGFFGSGSLSHLDPDPNPATNSDSAPPPASILCMVEFWAGADSGAERTLLSLLSLLAVPADHHIHYLPQKLFLLQLHNSNSSIGRNILRIPLPLPLCLGK